MTSVCFCVIAAIGCTPLLAADAWFDTYYQYRIPVVVEVPAAGWNAIALNEQQITTAINRLEELQFDREWFAYNYLTAVEVDAQGKVIAPDLEAGFYLVEQGRNLAAGALSGGQDSVEIPVDALATYLLRYTAAGDEASGSGLDRHSPMHRYENIFRPGSSLRKHNYRVSYEPPMLPKGRRDHERLFIPDAGPVQLEVGGQWVSGLEDVALHRAEIRLLANLRHRGRK